MSIARPLQRMLLTVALLLVCHAVVVQAQSTRGRDFWGGFMYNLSNAGELPDLILYVTSRVNTNGVVSIPRAAYSQPIVIPANTGTLVRLPADILMSLGSEGIENKAFHLHADDTVEVYAMNYIPRTGGASIVMAFEALGSEYYAVTYDGGPSPLGLSPAQFQIVACSNNTVVEITPSQVTLGTQPAGVPFTVTLQAGQVYQVQAAGDLTGTRVRTLDDKVFAFFSGSCQPSIPKGVLHTDHVYEQLLPVDKWGTYYVAMPLKTRAMDVYRIVAATNNTTVKVDGMAPFTLNAGEYREFQLSAAGIISSDNPIQVAQFAIGDEFDLATNGDPAMTVLAPTDFSRHDLTFQSFPKSNLRKHYVNIATLNVSLDQITLDGAQIASQFQPVPGDPFYAYAQIEVAPGQHHLNSLWGVNVYAYGFGDATGYLYNTGSDNLRPCISPVITALGDTVFCRGDSVTLDAGAGYLTYLWSTGESTRRINVTETGNYAVITIDSSGCSRPSRPVHVTVNELPTATIATTHPGPLCPCDSAILSAPPGLRYRWSTGDTTQQIVVRTAGTFGITVTNESGCVDSASTSTTTTDIQPSVAAGTASAEPGQPVRIPLYLTDPSNLAPCDIRDYTTTLRYHGGILHLEGVEGGTLVSDAVVAGAGRVRTATITGLRSGDTLAHLVFTAALGEVESTAVTVESFSWDRCLSVSTDTTAGAFMLLGICYEGGPRLLDLTGGTAIKSAVPNPAAGAMTIAYSVGEKGRYEIFLTDLLGRRVATIAEGERPPGPGTAVLATGTLSPGTYLCVLATANQRISAMVQVVR